MECLDRARIWLGLMMLIVIMGYPTPVWAANMLPPTVEVSQEIQDAVASALDAANPSAAIYYVITDVAERGAIYLVSVVGVNVTDWTLADAVWMGNVAVSYDYAHAAVDGTPEYSAMTAGLFPDVGGGVSEPPMFPVEPGAKVIYGPRGVHGDQYVAIDLLSGDLGSDFAHNAVYGSTTANITYICRDSYSVAVYAGNYVYMHLVDNAFLKVGNTIVRGQRFASMVPGTFNGRCGWAVQDPNHYHVHWGILRSTIPGTTVTIAGGWILDINTGQLRNGSVVVTPGDTFRVPGVGSSSGGGIGNVSGGHLWDGPVNAILNMAARIYPNFPDAASWDLANRIGQVADMAIRVVVVLIASNFNMTIPLMVISMILILEPIRALYALWMLVKRVIPFAG